MKNTGNLKYHPLLTYSLGNILMLIKAFLLAFKNKNSYFLIGLVYREVEIWN